MLQRVESVDQIARVDADSDCQLLLGHRSASVEMAQDVQMPRPKPELGEELDEAEIDGFGDAHEQETRGRLESVRWTATWCWHDGVEFSCWLQ